MRPRHGPRGHVGFCLFCSPVSSLLRLEVKVKFRRKHEGHHLPAGMARLLLVRAKRITVVKTFMVILISKRTTRYVLKLKMPKR